MKTDNPRVFCKYIQIDRSNFLKPIESNPLKVLLTVSWNGTGSGVPHNSSSTSWSQNVTLSGFKACVLVAGNHTLSDLTPIVHWVVFNFRDDFFRNSKVRSGIAKLGTWYTGTQCKKIASVADKDLADYRVLATANYNRNNYGNGIAVWTEHAQNTMSGYTYIQVCAREIQNINGKYEDIVIVSLI